MAGGQADALTMVCDALGGVALDAAGVDALPVRKGGYALVIELAAPLQVARPESAILPAGAYVYAGSAHGSGGVRSRLGRHFRRDKRIHWHVDQLTVAEGWIGAVVVDGLSECGIVALLEALPGFAHPIAGFGSSDCGCCRSHLLAVTP